MTKNIEAFTQNSSRITMESGKKIYIDPFKISENYGDADYIFITHDHYDHFSPEDIEKVKKEGTVYVFPETMKDKVEKALPGEKYITVSTNDKKETEDLTFETIPAYNIMKPFHMKHAGWVGYILTVDGKRIYIAGDTDATPEAEAVKCDVALIPAGGKYTCNAKEAAELTNAIKPQVVIPVHYFSEKDAEVFKEHVDTGIKVEVMIQGEK